MTAPPISPVKALKKGALGPLELLAQNIALISPTMTAALIVPLMYGTTGAWSWLSYALGTVMLLFVALNLNQFASRFAGSGSMYQYICKGLGNVVGGLGGWALIWCYLGISDAGLNGFTTFAQTLLTMVGINCPAIVLFVICILISGTLAYKNVALSAKLMLILEAASMAFITALVISWKLTLFIIFVGPLMVAIIKKFGKKMRRASRRTAPPVWRRLAPTCAGAATR